MHSTSVLEDGYLGSGKILRYSRKKHGDENHIKQILEYLPTRAALALREKEIVNGELLADPMNMNLRYGGDGGWIGGWDHVNSNKLGSRTGAIWSDESRAKMSRSKKGKKQNLSKEQRQKLSDENVSKRPEVKVKISAALTGRKISPDHKRKLAEAAKENWKKRKANCVHGV